MKTPADITTAVRGRLQKTWHLDATGSGSNWAHTIALGSLTATQLAADFLATREHVQALRDWAGANDIAVTDARRRVKGTIQPIPTHVTVADIDTAARLAGKEWIDRLKRGRTRGGVLAARYPGCDKIAKAVRLVDSWSDVDFELLQTVSDWFTTHTAVGLTPRQVPIPGVHAKWLNTGRPVVELLVGKPLELAQRHPPRIHFTYLDPDHLASGARRFDSATVGDTIDIAYKPSIVIISENKDTAINFPAIAGAIAVEGDGFAASNAAQFEWIANAPLVVYWGDLDAEGFEILDGYRRNRVPAVSILMGIETLRTHAPWGTTLDKAGRAIKTRAPKPLPTLTYDERAAYAAVCAGGSLPPRLEQERVPLKDAHAAVLRLSTSGNRHDGSP